MKQPEVSKQPEAAGAAPELIVFSILRASQCSQCKTKLESGSFLTLEKGQPLCMTCADLDHLTRSIRNGGWCRAQGSAGNAYSWTLDHFQSSGRFTSPRRTGFK